MPRARHPARAAAAVSVLALILAIALLAIGAAPIRAEAATIGVGPGVDTCQAPSIAALHAWIASPYRMLAIYLGGANRACSDGPLSASWVDVAEAQGYLVAPLYVGLQAPCVGQGGLATIDPRSPLAQGAAAADDAVTRARVFGIPVTSPIYFDMEAYAVSDPACSLVVLVFVSAWTSELHRLGYRAGVYGSVRSAVRDLAAAYGRIATPDDIWFAHWDDRATVWGDPYLSDARWPAHERIHQYLGGHDETWGGVTLNVDSDWSDGEYATVVRRRGAVLRADGMSGYALDGFGALHPFGGAAPVALSAYWAGWDIARGIVLRGDGVSGYVLDGWGGVHPFGAAPALGVSAYWAGWDIARGIALRSDGTGGYVLDGWGGVHPFGAAPALGVSAYWAGWDIARGIALRAGDAGGYVLDSRGGMQPTGAAPAIGP